MAVVGVDGISIAVYRPRGVPLSDLQRHSSSLNASAVYQMPGRKEKRSAYTAPSPKSSSK
jgi:hypothetical protein